MASAAVGHPDADTPAPGDAGLEGKTGIGEAQKDAAGTAGGLSGQGLGCVKTLDKRAKCCFGSTAEISASMISMG